MASRKIILRCSLPVVEVNADHQNDEEIAKDNNVVRKSEAKSRHRHLLDMDLDINKSTPKARFFAIRGNPDGDRTV